MRHLYLAFLLAFAILVIGFWPTTIGGAAGALDWLRIVHGILATLWMAMLVAQSWLAGRWRLKWHRRIGWTSVAIVPALVISALLVVADMLRHSTYFPRDLRLSLAWADILSLILFSLLWGMAIRHRKSWPLHARYVGCTVFAALPPALGRVYGAIPGIGGLTGALPPSYITVELVLLALIVLDFVRGGAPRPYAIALAGTAAIHMTLFSAPHWPLFVRFAEAIGPIG